MPLFTPNGERYGAASPPATHRRKATCEEVRCEAFLDGFYMELDPDTFGNQVLYLRSKQHGRRFTEERLEDGRIRFNFPAGQECFESTAGRHTVPNERAPFYTQARSHGRRLLEGDQWIGELGDDIIRGHDWSQRHG